MIRRPPRSTLDRSSAASDVYKRQECGLGEAHADGGGDHHGKSHHGLADAEHDGAFGGLSLIHISEPTRPY